jgi:hypothetical protein
MACRLAGAGERVDLVCLIDASPSGHPPTTSPAKFGRSAVRGATDRAVRPARSWMARRGLLDRGRPERDMQALNLKAAQRYVTPSYGGTVDLILSDRAGADAVRTAWAELARGGVTEHRVPGPAVPYGDRLREPNVVLLAATVRDLVDRALADDGGVDGAPG